MSSTSDDAKHDQLNEYLVTSSYPIDDILKYNRLYSFKVVASSEEKAREIYPYAGTKYNISYDSVNDIWKLTNKDGSEPTKEERSLFFFSYPWIHANHIKDLKVTYIREHKFLRSEGHIIDMINLKEHYSYIDNIK